MNELPSYEDAIKYNPDMDYRIIFVLPGKIFEHNKYLGWSLVDLFLYKMATKGYYSYCDYYSKTVTVLISSEENVKFKKIIDFISDTPECDIKCDILFETFALCFIKNYIKQFNGTVQLKIKGNSVIGIKKIKQEKSKCIIS